MVEWTVDLTASERILLHIAQYWRTTEAVSELTQQGIASGAQVRRSHVPRNLKRLISEGLVEATEGRIGGRARRVNYYRTTEAGLRQARELRESLLGARVLHCGKEATVADLAKQFGLTPLGVAIRVDGSSVFHPPVMALQVLPGLIEREEDMAYLKRWLREGGPVMVVYGAAGMGKTALGRALISQHNGPHIWVDLRDGVTLKDLLSELAKLLSLEPPEGRKVETVIERIGSKGILAVLDGYHLVSEDVVDFLANTVETLGGGGKLLVLAQETTPSYCRFHSRDAVSRGRVWELHLRGLSMDGCRKMLESGRIDDEALKRIYLLTKGIPLYLDLIRRGDEDELRRRSRFTNAEIRLLMFSKDVSSRA